MPRDGAAGTADGAEMIVPSCPECQAYKSVELIAYGHNSNNGVTPSGPSWWLCNACSARLLFDEAGQVLRVVLGHEDKGFAARR